jgi:hypothetical protein
MMRRVAKFDQLNPFPSPSLRWGILGMSKASKNTISQAYNVLFQYKYILIGIIEILAQILQVGLLKFAPI